MASEKVRVNVGTQKYKDLRSAPTTIENDNQIPIDLFKSSIEPLIYYILLFDFTGSHVT